MRQLVVLFLLTLLAWPVHARVEAYQFDNPEDEARYKQLIDELRCLVCQNQNLADSNAELAQDLRRLTYEMVIKGSHLGIWNTTPAAIFGFFLLVGVVNVILGRCIDRWL